MGRDYAVGKGQTDISHAERSWVWRVHFVGVERVGGKGMGSREREREIEGQRERQGRGETR